jgi:predicted RNA polymerase sigma factor
VLVAPAGTCSPRTSRWSTSTATACPTCSAWTAQATSGAIWRATAAGGTVGDLGITEDAVQGATIATLREWSASGVPESPRAWLTAVTRRKATDLLRRESLRGRKEREATELLDQSAPEPA